MQVIRLHDASFLASLPEMTQYMPHVGQNVSGTKLRLGARTRAYRGTLDYAYHP